MKCIPQNIPNFFLCVVLAAIGLPAVADDDSNADSVSFFRNISQSQGIILRVEINENGEENTENVSLRLADQSAVDPDDRSTVAEAWESGQSADGQPEISAEDIRRDSSTRGFFHYRRHGWYRPYYYYGYTPTYYNYNTYYVANAYPVYYSSYSPWSSIYGYRYYYYHW